jgi:hypothetical protein
MSLLRFLIFAVAGSEGFGFIMVRSFATALLRPLCMFDVDDDKFCEINNLDWICSMQDR